MYRTHLKLSTYVVPSLLIIALLVSAWYINSLSNNKFFQEGRTQNTTTPDSVINEETNTNSLADFIETGTISNFNATLGKETSDWRFIYEKPGASALETLVVFDQDSECNLGDGFKPCSKTRLENGIRVKIEGIDNANEVSVLRLIKIAEDTDQNVNSNTISWDTARKLIANCEVKQITQAHDLTVMLDLNDGSTVTTREPEIDEIFELVEEAIDFCGQPQMATE